ncbi:hypothetical protein [Mesorhizobium sp.]|uniref:hypothetical protein n=1 Tax=Mesorhizobium sp. TaxID=1871066 RepID=UPI000FE88BC9|nr:hypothetical protein [Mesorhizobium sp.]RWI35443.1 MAG: hypothetical protein EOR14_28490 [Mesorhizobium sp.]RWJ66388.1 MAG: hypothetical protein EOR34_28645 [Mesorhizobium sp.]
MQAANSVSNSGVSMDVDTPRCSPLEDDIQAWNFISKSVLAHEMDLFGKKWFDYRQLTPMQATRVYIDQYGEIYRRHFAANYDRERAAYVKPITVDGIMAGLKQNSKKARRAFVGCWRGRQIADFLCMPYEIYIDLAFKARLDYWQQGHLPLPVHLYGQMVVEKIVDRWQELQASRLFTSDNPAYLVHNYAGIGHQDDYHEWLFSQAAMRSNPPATIARFVNDNQLPFDKVAARFDEDTLERVTRHLH